MAQIEAAAQTANKTPNDWVVEVMQRQLEENRWQKMLEQNERHVRRLGIKETDVPDLVHQDRLERKR